MDRSVRWTPQALTQLQEAADYIAAEAPTHAVSFVEEARRVARSLATHAGMGRIVPEFEADFIREVFVKRYRMVYAVFDERVEIVAFIHGSRDFRKAWNSSLDED